MLKFHAYLKDTGHPIKIDSEGQAELVLVVPASDLPCVLPIVTLGKKILIVGIAEEEGEAKDAATMEKWLTS